MPDMHQKLQPSRQWYHQPRQATADIGRCQRQGLIVFNLRELARSQRPWVSRTSFYDCRKCSRASSRLQSSDGDLGFSADFARFRMSIYRSFSLSSKTMFG